MCDVNETRVSRSALLHVLKRIWGSGCCECLRCSVDFVQVLSVDSSCWAGWSQVEIDGSVNW